MQKIILKWVASVALVSFCTCVAAALPTSGTINFRSINKGTSMVKYNQEYTHGTVAGVTFNDIDTGPMHMGKAACSYSIFSHRKIIKSSGFCALEDKEGDKIFIQYAGSSSAEGEWSGTDDIIGGTGKYEGIQGRGPYSCANTHKDGEFPCTAKLVYQLP